MKDHRIHFGALRNFFGKPAEHESFWFVPAALKLDGDGFSTGFHLRDFAAGAPEILALPIKHGYDASWVRARLPRVFGFTPVEPAAEKSLLEEGFVALPSEGSVGFPFVCTDSYGRTGLMFSPNGPEEATQLKIAEAFWSLLLLSPQDVVDFQTAVHHPGAGIWMHFGCEDCEPWYRETRDEMSNE